MASIDRIGRLKRPLVIKCHACGHGVTWSKEEAVRRLGSVCTVLEARRRLFCSRCGARGSLHVDFH